jgi:hypothetical protein
MRPDTLPARCQYVQDAASFSTRSATRGTPGVSAWLAWRAGPPDRGSASEGREGRRSQWSV